MSNQLYPSDMADREWEYIKGMIPAAKPGGRKRQTDMRLSLNAIFYLIRTGYQWRHLPREYPPRETVQGYFRTWRIAGVWERIHYQCATLYESRKGMSGNRPLPSSIDRASRPLIVVALSAAMTQVSESTGGKGIS